MSVDLEDVLPYLQQLYQETNEHLTWGRFLQYTAAGLAAYTTYCFGIKPFLSPLRALPGPGYNPLFGNVREAMVGQAMDSSVRWVKKYGGVLRFYHLLGRERVLVADPVALKQILVTNVDNYQRVVAAPGLLGTGIFTVSGEEHKYQRRLLNPHFNHQNIDGYLKIFEQHGRQLVEYWQSKMQSGRGTEIDIQDDLMRATLDVVGKAVFGYNFNCLEDPNSQEANAFHMITGQQGISFAQLIPFYGLLPTSANKVLWKNTEIVNNVIFGIISEKRELLQRDKGNESVTKDLLGRMMLAVDEDTGQGMSDMELRDQVLSLIIAGHETTAQQISWLLLILANNQDIQTKLREEITTKLPDSDSPITWQKLDQLNYLTSVIKEGQRLYPVAPSFYRRVVRDDHLNGYFIPAGTLIVYHVGAMMRNPAVWPDPEKYDPERFNQKDVDMYTYLPFITGAHKCLGHQFALMEIKTMLSVIIQSLQFTPIPDLKFVRKLRTVLKSSPPIRLLAEEV